MGVVVTLGPLIWTQRAKNRYFGYENTLVWVMFRLKP